MPRTHKALKRVFVEAPLAARRELPLDKRRSNYLLNVLRSRAGDKVIVFNGRDGAWLADIGLEGKKTAVLTPIEQTAEQPHASGLWYGFAPLKTGRLDYMMQKATEMGAGTIQPVVTAFTQKHSVRPDKLRANAIEAAEQCEVLSVPRIAPETTLDNLIENWTIEHGARRLIFADEDRPSGAPFDALRPLAGERVGLLIGPEGGFSDAERALLHAQDFVVPISLGPRILRADTAAVAALAVTQSIIGDWR